MNAQEIAILVNKYKKSDNKVLFFNDLSDNEKVVLYSKLDSNSKKELISSLPYRPIKKLFEASKKDVKKEILKLLSSNQLRDIYTNSSINKQQEIQKLINEVQIGLSESQSSYIGNIVTNSNSRNISYNNIASNTENISQNKMDLKDKKKELKTQNKVIKKTSKERERALNKLLKAENNLHKRSSRIAIISNYRMNKYNERLASFQEKDSQLNEDRNTKIDIEKDIDNLHKGIDNARKEIREEKEKIKKYNSEISQDTKYLGETQAKLKQLSKEEKRILGRKLYNKRVSQRDKALVRKKDLTLDESGEILDVAYATNPSVENPTYENKGISTPEEGIPNAESKINPEQAEAAQPNENVQSHIDSKIAVESVTEIIKLFNSMGITFNNDQNTINIYQNGELKYNVPISSISEDKNIILAMAMLYGMKMQDLPEDLEESQDRSRGSINIAIVVTFIILILGVILFVMN